MSTVQGFVVTVAITAGIYFRTLHPSVAGGDSGELMCVAHELATPHPPGYPTFAVATHLAERIVRAVDPSIPVAVAQNGFHAFLSALAAGLLFCATHLLGGGVSGGFVAAFLFAFAPSVWTYAIVTEVFALNNFFLALLLVQATLYSQHLMHDTQHSARMRLIYISAFTCGLSCTNQHTSVLFVVPIVLWVLATTPSVVTNVPKLVSVSACFFAGMLPYVYLPLSATLWPSPNSWGRPNSLQGFATHFFRLEYGTFSLASKESTYRVWNFTKTWGFYLRDLYDQIGVAVVFALIAATCVLIEACRGPLGAWLGRSFGSRGQGKALHCVRRGGPHGSTAPSKRVSAPQAAPPLSRVVVGGELLLLLTWLLYCCFFNYLSNLPIDKPLFFGVQQRFWIQPLLITCMFVGVGFARTAKLLRTRVSRVLHRLLIVAAVVAICVVQVSSNYYKQDEHENYYVRDFGRLILAPLPNNSIILTMGDLMINSARFVQVTEKFRPDVRILDQELMTFEWYNDVVRVTYPDIVLPGSAYFPMRPGKYDIRTFLDRNRNSTARRVFLVYGWKEGDHSYQGKYTTRTFGMTAEVITIQEQRAFDEALAGATSVASAAFRKRVEPFARELLLQLPANVGLPIPPPGRYPEHSWEVVVRNDVQHYLTVNGYSLMSMGQKYPARPLLSQTEAAEALAQSRGADTSNDDSGLSHLFYPMMVERNITRLVSDESLPMGYRLLMLARFMMVKALATQVPRERQLPTYVRRNLGVCLQHLEQYHPDSRALTSEVYSVFKGYVEDAQRRGELQPGEEKASFDAVLRHYSSSQQSANNP